MAWGEELQGNSIFILSSVKEEKYCSMVKQISLGNTGLNLRKNRLLVHK